MSEIKPVGWVVGPHSDTPAWSRYRMDLTTLGEPEPVYTADQIRQAVEEAMEAAKLRAWYATGGELYRAGASHLARFGLEEKNDG